MKSIIALATASLATALGFYDICSSTWSLGYHGRPGFLIAQCPASDGTQVSSTIDLNDCLENSEGALSPKPVGYAFESCVSCTASNTSANITCSCQETSGRSLISTFDLNTVISSNDGIIGCFNFPGFQISPEDL